MPTLSSELPEVNFIVPVVNAHRGTPVTISVRVTVYNKGTAIVCLNLSGTSTIYFKVNGTHTNSICKDRVIAKVGQPVQVDFVAVLDSKKLGSLRSQIQASVTDSKHRASSNNVNLHLT